MNKFYSLILILLFIVFSCKGTPDKDKGKDDPGLSQLELTSEEDETGPGFDDEPQSDESSANENALTQDGVTDIPESAENPAEEKTEEKPVVVEAKDEVKEPPKTEEKKPAAPAAKPVQPPLAVIKEEPSAAKQPADEKPADEKKDAQSESDEPPPPPPRYQPLLPPPPAVTAVKDDAPIPNQRGLTVPPKEEEIVFSRIVRAMVGQFVEIPFRGNNWSYLENTASRRGIVYDSRRNDSEGVIFLFKAEEAGTYTLKFYRRDYIRDYILNDYVQVIVSESPNKNGNAGWFSPPGERVRVTAEPRWPSALDEAATLRGGAKPASSAQPAPQTAPQTAPQSAPQSAPQALPPNVVVIPQGTSTPPQAGIPQAAAPQMPQAVAPQPAPQTPPTAMPPAVDTPPEKQEILPPEEILKRAQENFTAGKTAEAIALLDQYNEYYPGGDDELYWLYGQFYEANTPSRNILLSLDYYRRLVNEYPQSRRYNDARRRISYLERFYINIQ